jgi:ubiquinone/menaquinone biosynthesis methyltransferase
MGSAPKYCLQSFQKSVKHRPPVSFSRRREPRGFMSLDPDLAPAGHDAAPSGRPIAELSGRASAGEPAHAVAVRRMFDRISPTYDLLNRLLSAGIDRRWRERTLAVLSQAAPEGPVLDSCAGTLDLALGIAGRWPGRTLLAGDFAREMLLAGRAKLPPGAQALMFDAMRLPFAERTFAGVTCGFGMRNLADPLRGIGEAHRVLVPGGAFVVLEFFQPTRVPTRLFHAVYARAVLPLVGRLVSGDGEAYGYLARSMRGFMTRGQFEDALRAAGFREVRAVDLTFGIASLVWGLK